jgi:V8-like Glu-specific endopeptidase
MKIISVIVLLASSFHLKATTPYVTDSIYDIDNRELISQESKIISTPIKQLSKSVAIIFSSDDLITENDKLLIFANCLNDPPPYGMNTCSSERFANHHAYRSACSGFLVAEDLLATAGHCFETQYSCDNQLIAFDVDSNSEISRGFKVDQKNIYHCKEIVAQAYNRNTLQDYAIIKLDRKSERAPLQMRTSGEILDNEQVFLIGHPLGLPLTYSPAAKIVDDSNSIFFKAQVNAFHGNSGSPVFNAKTQLVEGILVRGEEDVERDSTGSCEKYIKYLSTNDVDKLKGESATRIKYILPFVPFQI